MKKSASFIIILAIIISLLSCERNKDTVTNTLEIQDTFEKKTQQKTEISGVPDLLILERTTIPENEQYTIYHNYDKVSNVDQAILETVYKGNFGIRTTKYGFEFLYDETIDSWSDFGGKKLLSEETEFDETAFCDYGHFVGIFNMYESGTYDIEIEELNFEEKTAKVKYSLFFDRDGAKISGEDTLEIVKGNGVEKWAIIIHYSRSMVVRFEQVFVFDIENGLYSYEQ